MPATQAYSEESKNKEAKPEASQKTTEDQKYPKKKDEKLIDYITKKPIKYIKDKEWYKHREANKEKSKEIKTAQNDADLSSIKEGAVDEIQDILVFVSEIPTDNRSAIYAPIFLSDRKKIFGSNTDVSFKWVGYKATLDLKQKGFPWKSASLTETIVGSFLYASGTNIGFNRGSLQEENRFYTNYFSEIVTLKQSMPLYTGIAFTVDSRQYFFVERDTPEGFVMPKNHYNFFPRVDLSLDRLTVSGIDQLTKGVKLSTWIGYGVRSRWEEWGEPGNPDSNPEARKFIIYSSSAFVGFLFHNDHNLVFRGRFKGGYHNDFLTRPRFGGTIDNADLDVVHGFTLDEFRVRRFGLLNTRYSFNIFTRLRLNLFFDYSRIFSPVKQDIFGTAYGFRIIAWGGLPIWMTHGMGKIYSPEEQKLEHVLMIMTAAGW